MNPLQFDLGVKRSYNTGNVGTLNTHISSNQSRKDRFAMTAEYLTPKPIEVPLTQGYIATISPEDSDLLQYVWSALKEKRTVYAIRSSVTGGKKRTIWMHRVILSRQLGRELTKGEYADHEDGNGCNNTRKNIRLASSFQNARNSKIPTNNTSGYKGVDFQKHVRKWRARICVNNKSISLGWFDNPEDAYRAYCEASVKYHGEFANNGSVDNSPLMSNEYNPETLKLPRCKYSESNQRGVYKNEKSGRWYVKIKFKGKSTYLGTYDTIEEAAEVYNRKKNELYGIKSQ